MKSGKKKRKSSSGNKTKSSLPSSELAIEQKPESKLEKLKPSVNASQRIFPRKKTSFKPILKK